MTSPTFAELAARYEALRAEHAELVGLHFVMCRELRNTREALRKERLRRWGLPGPICEGWLA